MGIRHKPGLHSSGFLQNNSDARIPAVPIEWLGGGPWRLPSGKALAEFALQSGFLAPLAFNPGRPAAGRRFDARRRAESGVSEQR